MNVPNRVARVEALFDFPELCLTLLLGVCVSMPHIFFERACQIFNVLHIGPSINPTVM